MLSVPRHFRKFVADIEESINVCLCVALQFLMYDNTAKTMNIVLFDEDPDEDDKLGK